MTPLEALKRLKDLEDLQGGRDEFFEYVKVIETALKRLEMIDSGVVYTISTGQVIEQVENFMKLKAFEIIKEKKVSVKDLINAKTLNIYNCNRDWWEMLVQEEFDLLKEVLK